MVIRSTAEDRDYHLNELAIALEPDDPRHILPSVPPAARRILDVGCGAGQTFVGLGLAADAFAVGIDPSSEALALGRELTRSIRFVCGVGESLPFRDGTFDFVISRVAMPYMNIPQALREVRRVLAPNGELWIVLQTLSMTLGQLRYAVQHGQPKAAAYQLYALANGLLLHTTGRLLRWPSGGGRYESFQTTYGIGKALKAARFVGVKVTRGRHFVVTARKGSVG